MYYIYAHKKSDGEVFYVGKGSGKRQFISCNRSVYWKRVVKKYGFVSFLLESDLTEEEAFAKEIEWIAHYKKLGQCRVNFTNGGDGVRVPYRWWNEAISKSLKGRKLPAGEKSRSYKHLVTKEQLYDYYVRRELSSVEITKLTKLSYTTIITRLRKYGIEVRKAGRKQRQIKCITDGQIFESINDAARHYKLFRENIRKVLNGKYKHTGGKQFVYVSHNSKVKRSSKQSAGRIRPRKKRCKK